MTWDEANPKLAFIGDIHGNFERYRRIVNVLDDNGFQSVQLGDFGAGFGVLPPVKNGHFFIRGNHDNPNICADRKDWIIDSEIRYCCGKEIGFLGGGLSIDRDQRTLGVDYWEDEEIPAYALYEIAAYFAESVKFDILVSHEGYILPNQTLRHPPSRTSQVLTSIVDVVKPKHHIHGHWHIDKTSIVGNTTIWSQDIESVLLFDFSVSSDPLKRIRF